MAISVFDLLNLTDGFQQTQQFEQEQMLSTLLPLLNTFAEEQMQQEQLTANQALAGRSAIGEQDIDPEIFPILEQLIEPIIRIAQEGIQQQNINVPADTEQPQNINVPTPMNTEPIVKTALTEEERGTGVEVSQPEDFDTAEEFVKSQESKESFVHYTTEEKAKLIQETGEIRSGSLSRGKYRFYGEGKFGDVAFEIDVKDIPEEYLNEKLNDFESEAEKSAFIDRVNSGVIDIGSIPIKKFKAVQTKSQLTDIWNKAKGSGSGTFEEVKIPKGVQNYLEDTYGDSDKSDAFGSRVAKILASGGKITNKDDLDFINNTVLRTDAGTGGTLSDRISDAVEEPTEKNKLVRWQKGIDKFRQSLKSNVRGGK